MTDTHRILNGIRVRLSFRYWWLRAERSFIDSFWRIVSLRDPKAIYPIRRVPPVYLKPGPHPEVIALQRFCKGKGIDVGCGADKISPDCIGVDIIPKGDKGEYGVVSNRISAADVNASGDELPFKDDELDYVVAKHNLEHYLDPAKALEEWKRVLKPGGVMALVVPDERAGDTIFLDPTHKHVFTPDSLSHLVRLIGGFEIEEISVPIPGWSFLFVARKKGIAQLR